MSFQSTFDYMHHLEDTWLWEILEKSHPAQMFSLFFREVNVSKRSQLVGMFTGGAPPSPHGILFFSSLISFQNINYILEVVNV